MAQPIAKQSMAVPDEKLTGSDGTNWLENTKPPSIMEHSSLMSQSSASISSSISDIALDETPVRPSTSSELVAAVASNGTKEMNELLHRIEATHISRPPKTSKSIDNLASEMAATKQAVRCTLSNGNDDCIESDHLNSKTYVLDDERRPASSFGHGSNWRTHGHEHHGPRRGHEADDDMSDTDISESLPFDEPRKPRCTRQQHKSRGHRDPEEKTRFREIVDPMLMYGQRSASAIGGTQSVPRRKKTKRIVTPQRKYIEGRDDLSSSNDECDLVAANNASMFYNQQQHSLRRTTQPNTCKSTKDKAVFLPETKQLPAAVVVNQAQCMATNQNSIKTASKYFDRQILESSEATRNSQHHTEGANNLETIHYWQPPQSQASRSQLASPSKLRKGKLLSNFKSMLASSISAHALAGSSTATSPAPSRKSQGVGSKIVSMFRRSKSTHDKLEKADGEEAGSLATSSPSFQHK